MATVKQMKATARSRAGKGAARAERRAGRVPGVIYGDGKPPLTVSVDHAELKQRIYAGRFLTTIYELDVDGAKHRVIPRDFQLDAVKDLPVHVDFLRLGEGAQIRVRIPVHVMNADQAPGVKRGGTVNIVTHAVEVECSADDIPESIDVDISGLEINYSKHLSDVDAAAERAGDRASRSDAGHHRAAVGLRGRNEGGRRSRRRCGRCGCRRRRSGRSRRRRGSGRRARRGCSGRCALRPRTKKLGARAAIVIAARKRAIDSGIDGSGRPWPEATGCPLSRA